MPERRAFLLSAAMPILAGLAGGVRLPQPSPNRFGDRPIEGDPALLRAGTIRIINEGGWSQAALVEMDGDIGLLSVGHVVKKLKPEKLIEVRIPGVPGFLRLDNEFNPLSSGGNPDVGMLCRLDLGRNRILDQALADHLLRPFNLANFNPSPGEVVTLPGPVMPFSFYPDPAGFYPYVYQRLIRDDSDGLRGLIELKSVNGDLFCVGRSGCPVVRVVNGSVVPEIYALVTNVYDIENRASLPFNSCGRGVYARPSVR